MFGKFTMIKNVGTIHHIKTFHLVFCFSVFIQFISSHKCGRILLVRRLLPVPGLEPVDEASPELLRVNEEKEEKGDNDGDADHDAQLLKGQRRFDLQTRKFTSTHQTRNHTKTARTLQKNQNILETFRLFCKWSFAVIKVELY